MYVCMCVVKRNALSSWIIFTTEFSKLHLVVKSLWEIINRFEYDLRTTCVWVGRYICIYRIYNEKRNCLPAQTSIYPIQPCQPTPLHAILSHPSSRTASHSAIQPTNHNWNFINLSENSMMMMTTMFCSITPQSSMAKGWRLRFWVCVCVAPTFLCYSCCCKQLPTSSSSFLLLLLLLLLQNKSYQKVF